MNELDESDP